MQVNEQGEVALKHYQPAQVLVQNTPSGKEYVFTTRANICLAWIQEGDVQSILSRTGGCCGGRRKLFDYANESDVRRWTNGGGF